MAHLWPTRRSYAAATLAMAIFVVYGSLVPLHFTPIPVAQAWANFKQVRYYAIGIGSRADLVSNILLFIPLAYFLIAALRTDRIRWAGHLIVGTFVIVVGAAASVTLEFVQVFFPGRTVSQNDMIAETAGSIV